MIKRLVRFSFFAHAILATSIANGAELDSAAHWLRHFSANWDESAWTGGRRAYIRPLDDQDWKLRMRTLRGLSRLGGAAADELLKTVKTGDSPSRILAAQALGYLGSEVTAEQLLDLLQNESNASVRLYLVDALGMMGKGPEVGDSLRQWRETETNGDVRKHIGYVFERGAIKVGADVLQDLRSFDDQTVASAQLGKPAPNFRLKTPSGLEIELSQFKGKKPVVLVFIYGDT